MKPIVKLACPDCESTQACHQRCCVKMYPRTCLVKEFSTDGKNKRFRVPMASGEGNRVKKQKKMKCLVCKAPYIAKSCNNKFRVTCTEKCAHVYQRRGLWHQKFDIRKDRSTPLPGRQEPQHA